MYQKLVIITGGTNTTGDDMSTEYYGRLIYIFTSQLHIQKKQDIFISEAS